MPETLWWWFHLRVLYNNHSHLLKVWNAFNQEDDIKDRQMQLFKKRKFWEEVDKERPDHPLSFCNFRNTFTWIYYWKAAVFSKNRTERCPKASLSEPIMAQCRYDTSLTRLPGAFAFLSSIFTEFWAVSILFVLNASQEISKTSKTKLALDRQCLSVNGMYCILSYPALLHCR